MSRLTRRSFARALTRARAPLVATLLAAAGVAGCFTNPINRAPVVSELDPVGQVNRGQDATFTARGSDPDQDPITWTWAVRSGDCPDPMVPSNWPPGEAGQTGAPTTYVVPGALTSAPFCVWAFATDRYGATGPANRPVDPFDNPPIAVIQLISPNLDSSYPAYTSFALTADGSSDPDGDPLTFDWNLDQVPTGSQARLIPCAGDASDTQRCFSADLPSQYVVTLAVGDGYTTTRTSLALLVLPDSPPCIAETDPAFDANTTLHRSAADPGSLVVSQVVDDGDPFPPNAATPLQKVHFTWFVGKNDGPLRYVDNADFPQLSLSANDYQIGDTVDVRLEVHDRNQAAIDQILSACGDAADFCAAPATGMVASDPRCNVRYVRVGWRIVLDR